MSKPDVLRELTAAVERDIEPLLRHACDDLYIDDAERLKALGVLLSKAWVDGAAAGHRSETVAEALDGDLELDDGAVAAALADKVKPPVSVQDVLHGIAARVRETGGATGKSATRQEIATQINVPADEVSREGAPPDGPLGRAVELGYVEQHPTYRGYWRLTSSGDEQLSS